jgi:hypothetical protein
LDAFLWDTIRLCPGVHERMTQAELIGPARATGNYSYYSRRMWGEGYILVGDAYAFVDPVFSSGVYLAMSGAAMGAEVVDTCLREGRSVDQLLEKFESRMKGGLRTLSWFIHRFTTPATHDLFMAPRDILGMERVTAHEGIPAVFLSFGRRDHDIALFKVPDGRALGHHDAEHFAFELDGGLDDLRAFKARLHEKGVTVTGCPNRASCIAP